MTFKPIVASRIFFRCGTAYWAIGQQLRRGMDGMGTSLVDRLAALNSQWLLRTQGYALNDDWQPEVKIPPDGGLASAYYSIANALSLYWRYHCLKEAGQYVRRAIETRGGPTDNLLATRGSIRLRMWNIHGAIEDFEELVKFNLRWNASEEKKADALMHLGYAHSFFPFSPKGRALLQASVDFYRAHPENPNLARALRKLVFAYRLAGRFGYANELLNEARTAALKIAAYNQVP